MQQQLKIIMNETIKKTITKIQKSLKYHESFKLKKSQKFQNSSKDQKNETVKLT